MAPGLTFPRSAHQRGGMARWERTTEGVLVSVQTWTPAPKKGIIPLHPLSFGTILGRAFAALRHNPRVLFGFAVVVQLIVVLVTAALMGVVLFTTFSRLETLTPASPDFEAV